MPTGRQRNFDKQKTLALAMNLFWKKGFIGASLSELTHVMGINKPSMYAAFGNKEDLFVSAVEHYLETEAAPHVDYLQAENTSLDIRLKNYLLSVTRMLCDPTKPGGCFVAVSCVEAGGDSLPEKAQQAIEDANLFTENFLSEFFQSEIKKGNLEAATNVADITSFILTCILGSAALARNGKSQAMIEPVIDMVVASICK